MQPLEGMRVLDLTRLAPGPHCTMILGDLGAEVIRIEEPGPPTGRRAEQARGADTAPEVERGAARSALDTHSPANALFRNKKSVALDLKDAEAREVFYRLVDGADVVVEEFRPGVAARLGIDFATLSARNPRLVHCAITGYGQDGPYRDLVGHDLNYISFAGALSLIGSTDRPAIPLNLLADFAGGGMHGALAILAAILVRERTGRGQYLDVAMTDGVVHLMAMIFNLWLGGGVVPEREGSFLNGGAPYYQTYETADGKHLSIGAVEPWFWANLCRALGREDLVPLQKDRERRAEVFAALREIFKQRTRDEWFDFLKDEDVCVAKVLTLDEVERDPHVRARGMIVELDAGDGTRVRQVGPLPKLPESPAMARTVAPALGEHTDGILTELGYASERIGALRARGAIR
jgi:crotonobetainyl-CoA:carnitine CoA-transferase CaiB-like acyl-CoA transferase